ncbi:hypothetical protein BDV41DRAFT_585192 [Aspergillus transmontanensis]|uniref:Uncharacterized protein n=1 Tax=Aspergillus transmontanensis TaxID=1034304 RepID=A0A5N6VEM4_9EURO|nr:hypothetical protein BDV41DRAFT_585192 [Aspergillus transmontanensis]
MGRYTNSLRKQFFEEALRPASGFDWAEAVEEALQQQYERWKSNDKSDGEAEMDDTSEEHGGTDTPISSQHGFDISPVWGEHRHADNPYGSKAPVRGTQLETPFGVAPASERCRLTTSALPQIGEGQEDDLYNSYENHYETVQMRSEVEQEFIFRNYCMEHDEERQIHHFNWLGYPLRVPSGTPAVISLLFQLADPKLPKPRDELRFQSIFARAMIFIDPVIVELERGLQDLDRRGFNLVRWATGRVSRYYTLHGRWTEDQFEWEECRLPDEGILEEYQSGSVACGNGFISLCNIRSRDQWAAHKAHLQEKYDQASRQTAENFHRRRHCKVYKPSLLSQSISLRDVECTAGETFAFYRKGFMLIYDLTEDHIETLSDSSIREQEYNGIYVSSRETIEGYCDDCAEMVANDRREGRQQRRPRCFGIHSAADRTTEMYENWQAIITSQHGTESTDTWEALSRTPNGGRKVASRKKSRLGRWKHNLKAWKVTLKGLMVQRGRLICTKAQKVFRKRGFSR